MVGDGVGLIGGQATFFHIYSHFSYQLTTVIHQQKHAKLRNFHVAHHVTCNSTLRLYIYTWFCKYLVVYICIQSFDKKTQ